METENIEIIEFSDLTVNNWEEFLFVQNQINTNIIINFPIIINPNNFNLFENVLKFKNCIFEFEIKIENVENPLFEITFINCKFKDIVKINGNKLKALNLIWHSEISYSEHYCNINSLFKKEMSVSSNKFEMFCKIERLSQINDSSFTFIGNVFLKQPKEIYPNSKTDYTICKISNCNINNGSFNGNKFYLPFDFTNNTLNYNTHYKGHTFKGNQFQKAFFSETNFGKIADFSHCNFYGTTLFENCKNLEETELKFVACKFEKYSLFDNSKFNNIEILHTKFLEKASFENFETHFFKIHQVTFAEAAYFDDLNKKNDQAIENWDRKTLRAIKRELVNTHNQIDYLRFKAYELEAFKKEKGKSWKDSLILHFNEDSNRFGLDWTKGIQFIIKWSFLFYLLYLISYMYFIRCFYLKPSQSDFFVNYIKFANPLSFLNPPLKNSENYFFPLLFLSLGKIFVSYGIYQTIQAFRKFGVNGG